ncbi:hypothetical protein QQF64_000185 [Cirrhinus molitorella]|uniref:Ig-like domain-containing protein n=1 Tax=Cirrhinus molitorella TaxID=172907 RepID=A0ABR3NX59_9TELE
MKIIWTFTLLMIPGVVSSGSVTGYSGGEVNITCKYKKENTANAKYLCKGKKPKKVKTEWRCELIKTEKKDEWVHSGGFSLYDDTRAAVFTVTIRNLSEQDSGTYHCGVDKTTKKDSYTEVKLDIITGSSLIIVVSVLLLLIITVMLLVIVTLWRRDQSHIQEPTGDSQILITSADDLNYAVVNFQKKSDCRDSVSLRNNQDYSEYAAVNHRTA